MSIIGMICIGLLAVAGVAFLFIGFWLYAGMFSAGISGDSRR